MVSLELLGPSRPPFKPQASSSSCQGPCSPRQRKRMLRWGRQPQNQGKPQNPGREVWLAKVGKAGYCSPGGGPLRLSWHWETQPREAKGPGVAEKSPLGPQCRPRTALIPHWVGSQAPAPTPQPGRWAGSS